MSRAVVREFLLGTESEPPAPTVATLVAGVNAVSSLICVATAAMHRGLPPAQRRSGLLVGTASAIGWAALLKERHLLARVIHRHPMRSAALNSALAGGSSWVAGGYKNPLYLQAWTQTAAATIGVGPRGGYFWGLFSAGLNAWGIKRSISLRAVRWNKDLTGLTVGILSLFIAGRIGALVGDVEQRERPLRAAVLEELPLVERRRELLRAFERCYDELCRAALAELPNAPVVDAEERRLALDAAREFAAGRTELQRVGHPTSDVMSLASDIRRWGETRFRGLSIDLSVRLDPRIPEQLDEDVRRMVRNVVQHGFQNIVRHAPGSSHVDVALVVDEETLVLSVIDDGGGDVVGPGAGTYYCKLEAARLGGQFSIGSTLTGIAQEARIPVARATAYSTASTPPALGHEPEERVAIMVERQLDRTLKTLQTVALLDTGIRVLTGETIEPRHRIRARAVYGLLVTAQAARRTAAGALGRSAAGALLTVAVPSYIPLCPLSLVGAGAEIAHRRGGRSGLVASSAFAIAVGLSAKRSSFSPAHRRLNADVPFAVAASTMLGVAFGWLARAQTARALSDEERLGSTQTSLDQLDATLEHARYWHHTVMAFRFALLPSVPSPVRARLHRYLDELDDLHHELEVISGSARSLEEMVRREVRLRVAPARVTVTVDEGLAAWAQSFPSTIRAAAASDTFAIAKLAGIEASELARDAPIDIFGRRRMTSVLVSLSLDGAAVSIELIPQGPAAAIPPFGAVGRVGRRLFAAPMPADRSARHDLQARMS